MDHLETFLASRTAQRFRQTGNLVGARPLGADERATLAARAPELNALEGAPLLEHERIFFSSFPYEWSPGMLHAAASLTLELAESALAEGLGLKDATPYNVLFRGSEPVFVDLLSFERRDPADPIWLPYAQFTRTFLLPLLVSKKFRLSPAQVFTGRRDGLEPEEIYQMGGWLRRVEPEFLRLVTLPTWLGGWQKKDDTRLYQEKRTEPERARYILKTLFRGLGRHLQRLQPRTAERSAWSDYSGDNSYGEEALESKNRFVEETLRRFKPRTVLDVGCNTGRFSRLAVQQGAQVIAIDADPVVIDAVWRRACREKQNILPLVVNLARPSPAVGWRNRECPSFLERARGRFEAVMMLAVLHHMMVGEGIPLEEILDLASELTTALLIIEYVDREDRMFQRIVRGRDYLYQDMSRERFEAACRERFAILECQQVGEARRWLYCLQKRKNEDERGK